MSKLKKISKTEVLYRSWISSREKAILLLVHGIGASPRRWNAMGEFFRKEGVSSYAIELKGFGETKGPRADIDSFDVYHKDILKLHNEIKRSHPQKKIFIVGESMGGLIAFVLAELNPELFSGMIAIAPGFKAKLKFPMIKLIASLLYNPKEKFKLVFNSTMLTHDKKMQRKLNSDKAELRYATARLLMNVELEQIRAQLMLRRIKVPILFLISGKDYIVSSDEEVKIFDRLPAKDKSMLQYPELFHALSIELGREHVFNDILSWLTERL